MAFALTDAPTQDDGNAAGAEVYETHCAACHNDANNKAPDKASLEKMAFDAILQALEFGVMQPQGAALDKSQKGAVAKYLAGDNKVDESWIAASQCRNTTVDAAHVISGNWGLSEGNRRYVSTATAGISKENVASLKVKWVFAYPKVTDVRTHPALTRDTIFTGSKSGNLFALDKKTGCIKWRYKADSSVRSGLVIGERKGKPTLFFGDALGTAYAVDANTGEMQWKQAVGLFPTSIITGSPTYHANMLYVPISSYEVAAAGMPQYPCCKSHGAVVAVDVASGETRWTWHATQEAVLQGETASGLQHFGPSGASVWSSPTVDEKRGLLYIGTGENTSLPATDTSDAIIAIELATGKQVWSYQGTKNDVWNAACLNGGPNCPTNPGSDLDFGASVILTERSDGKDILLAGQKSGAVYAFDPDGHKDGAGKLLWKNSDTENIVYSPNPGVHWGMAVENGKVFVPIADVDRVFDGYLARPGLYALDIDTGKRVWAHQAERGCEISEEQRSAAWGLEATRKGEKPKESDCSIFFSLSAAATATDGLVFAGRLDGKLQAYDSDTGKILWETETRRKFKGVNGIEGKGGSIDVDGPVLGDGMLFIHSGYSLFGQIPGNVLIAFEAEPVSRKE
jgi:polyvinyl alcohol dehydrogenase (cytochrome)